MTPMVELVKEFYMISLALASLIGAGLGAGAGIFSTVMNNKAVEDTNEQNLSLQRESWAREDNAVQRRVADLKAAGLSPTLAAGSAAASSGPISVKPKNYSGISDSVDNALSAVAAVKSLEKIDLENENLKKQGQLLDQNIKYYGMPDWMIAGNQIFGADDFLAKLKELGGKAFEFLSKPSFAFGSGSKSDDPSVSDVLKDAEKKLGAEALNESVKRGLSNAGIDVDPLTSVFDPTSYGKPLNDAVKKFANQMISDNMVTGDVISRLAHSLSSIYKVSFDDVISIFKSYLPGYNLIVQ